MNDGTGGTTFNWPALITTGVTACIMLFVMNNVMGSMNQAFSTSGQAELTSPTGPFATAAESVADAGVFIGQLFVVCIGLCLAVCAVGFGYGMLKYRKHWPLTAFGVKRYSRSQPPRHEHIANRCVNCYAEIESDGERNIARKGLVLFGFDVHAYERVETFECAACADADWFEYAMRADEHEAEMFEAEVDEAAQDSDASDTAEPVGCPECGQECKNDHGLRVHVGRQHPELMEELQS